VKLPTFNESDVDEDISEVPSTVPHPVSASNDIDTIVSENCDLSNDLPNQDVSDQNVPNSNVSTNRNVSDNVQTPIRTPVGKVHTPIRTPVGKVQTPAGTPNLSRYPKRLHKKPERLIETMRIDT
jgi:hypothetical protein